MRGRRPAASPSSFYRISVGSNGSVQSAARWRRTTEIETGRAFHASLPGSTRQSRPLSIIARSLSVIPVPAFAGTSSSGDPALSFFASFLLHKSGPPPELSSGRATRGPVAKDDTDRDGTGLSCVIAGLDPAIHDESQQGHKCLTSGIASWMPGSRPGRIYHQADIASCIANVHFCTQSRHGRAALGFISHGKFENAT